MQLKKFTVLALIIFFGLTAQPPHGLADQKISLEKDKTKAESTEKVLEPEPPSPWVKPVAVVIMVGVIILNKVMYQFVSSAYKKWRGPTALERAQKEARDESLRRRQELHEAFLELLERGEKQKKEWAAKDPGAPA